MSLFIVRFWKILYTGKTGGMAMVAYIRSMGLFGIDGFPVDVEADLSAGLPGFDVVGLPDTAVRESRDRVRAAIKNGGFSYPVSRITVNLAPAAVRKEGPIYDLPLFLALLAASGQLKRDEAYRTLDDCAFLGELSLTGEVRPVRGVLPMVVSARQAGIRRIFVPAANAAEGAVVDGIEVYPVTSTAALLAHLAGETPLAPAVPAAVSAAGGQTGPDFSDVMGQTVARRAAEIAAAGMHNLLFIGTPGSGKSMLARRIPSILPDMTPEEALAATKIHSVAGTLPAGAGLLASRPFRAPHHTISPQGLTGGGLIPRPGEVSLAHNGILFLDELAEFSRAAMESLRQPLEDQTVTISRVNASVTYPCSFMLVAAMNPCPCGYYGHPTRECTCSPGAVQRYLSRISGPLLDRIDMHVELSTVTFTELQASAQAESSASIRQRVNAAHRIQQERFAGTGITANARIPSSGIKRWCVLTPDAQALLRAAYEKLEMSVRGYDRLLKVARTIADLAGSEIITRQHIGEAIQYRSLDRKYWHAR